MAQIGSRLIDAAAAKITDDFFKAFEAQLQARQAPVRPPPCRRSRRPAVPARAAEPAGTLGWALAGIVVLVTLYFVLR